MSISHRLPFHLSNSNSWTANPTRPHCPTGLKTELEHLNPDSSPATIAAILNQFPTNFNAPYVHHRLVTFPTDKDRATGQPPYLLMTLISTAFSPPAGAP
ncbi:uncharacterized protein ACHE_10974A [Aspergillus chevalieri]|uniref:Uncharacterized protein n=1 Tax=Aspergillus chevalieri TaxID=182096 RepID=A0A7R7VFX1_ASPCH|nr:uncharacterized protein ACHE_10974A [Aspergillus chevalieri]BCR83572.1 hypothetical protein ACHE_10974A [Aspergillus chevalieri]